jgi:hypothetical protein
MELEKQNQTEKKYGMTDKHKHLQAVAIQWLYGRGCHAFAKEVPTSNGNADALGIKAPRDKKHTVYYIEAKASRSDLICMKQRLCYLKSVGARKERCYYHTVRDKMTHLREKDPLEECPQCLQIEQKNGDTGIDYYYLIVADGVKVEDHLYPEWGIISENGTTLRKAKCMKREGDTQKLMLNIAHVLVYKVFGKLYLIQ